MKKQVWKFKLTYGHSIGFNMPESSEFLTVQLQGGYPTAWFIVAPDAKKVPRVFETYGTGHDIPMNRTYLGTWQEGPLVWHLFEAEGGGI